jgi:hypothetical protein
VRLQEVCQPPEREILYGVKQRQGEAEEAGAIPLPGKAASANQHSALISARSRRVKRSGEPIRTRLSWKRDLLSLKLSSMVYSQMTTSA